jgi:3',5'-cyclic AMP phosphodiesterase CpdA
MRTLVHLSDLHFGRVDPTLLAPLVDAVVAAAPTAVVVSGDLTQRARREEFVAAREFMARLPGTQVVVPGNHDVPLYNVIDRLLRPLAGFRRYIEPEPLPRFVDDEMAIIGVNTARSLVVKNGRINEDQLSCVRDFFAGQHEDLVRVVVTHHPFDAGVDVGPGDRTGRAGLAMRAFAQCGVDLLLSGHLHKSYSGDTGGVHALAGYAALAVSAGTATSDRLRGETNQFNVLRLDKQRIAVECHAWSAADGVYRPIETSRFDRHGERWQRR